MNNIAIIPARSGSKGLKDKNIRKLNGVPLIGYSIQAAKVSGKFTHIMVSTDNEQYAAIARKHGAEVPFLRSAQTSGDKAGSWDVVREVLSGYHDRFDTVCLLQPTSPLRTAEDIVAGYRELENKNADAITAVCEMDHSPLWSMTLDESLSLTEFRRGLAEVPRQLLMTYYRINGALYIRKIVYEEGAIKILDGKEYAYIMNRNRSVDIDTIEDFEYAEFLIRGGYSEK
ncbi:acylneuraminate cytidylyltransferase family protein [Roseburia hominis]